MSEELKIYTVTRRFVLGGTSYAERLGKALAKHPEIVEVLKTEVVGLGKEGQHAVDFLLTYRATRYLSLNELASGTQPVPLYYMSEADQEDLEQFKKGLAEDPVLREEYGKFLAAKAGGGPG